MNDVLLIISSLTQVLQQMSEWAQAVNKAHSEGRTLSDAERDAFRAKAVSAIDNLGNIAAGSP